MAAGFKEGTRANGLTFGGIEPVELGSVVEADALVATSRDGAMSMSPEEFVTAVPGAGFKEGARANGLIFGLGVESSTTAAV